jgi:IS605 OrfB family transposase
MPSTKTPAETVRVLRLRLKDKHADELRELAYHVNQVWNYCNDLSFKILQREQRFASAYELDTYTAGAVKEGLPLHSTTVQSISAEFVTRRKQFKKAKLRWRVSGGAKRSLGWVPFKASALRYRNGQLFLSGVDKPLSLWDSYGLADYELGTGSLSEDARGRWYINICVKVKKAPQIRVVLSSAALGADLGLKSFLSDSNGNVVEAQRFYRDLEPKIAVAQRAGKSNRVRALHAKVANRRKDFLHKLSTEQVNQHCAIFVGDVNASGLAKTTMAKSVLDAGWSAYRTMLKYKCDDAGVWFKEVNESYSTQTCHVCCERTGPKGRPGLSVRKWTCDCCGTEHDRDQNASQNILNTGLEWLENAFSAAAGMAEMPDAVVNKAFAAVRRSGPRSGMTV